MENRLCYNESVCYYFSLQGTSCLFGGAGLTSTPCWVRTDSCLQLSQQKYPVRHVPQRQIHTHGMQPAMLLCPEDQLNVSFTQQHTHTHTYTCTQTNTQSLDRGSWRRRGMRYGNPCPLISSSDNYVWRSFVPCFGKTLHKSLWNWHDGYSWRQLLPPGLSPHPSSPCCL